MHFQPYGRGIVTLHASLGSIQIRSQEFKKSRIQEWCGANLGAKLSDLLELLTSEFLKRSLRFVVPGCLSCIIQRRFQFSEREDLTQLRIIQQRDHLSIRKYPKEIPAL